MSTMRDDRGLLEADAPTQRLDARRAAMSETTIPSRSTTRPADVPRPVGGLSLEQVLMAVGSGVSSVSLAALLFGQIAPLSGKLGFVVVAFVLYLVIYATLASFIGDRPAVIDRVMTALMSAAAVVAGFALATVIIFTFWRGREALLKLNFFTEDMSLAGPLDPLEVGGILHAIVGTLIIMALSLVLTVPLALACAVFLNETDSKGAGLVRTVVTAMTALPSILAGLFIFATWILILGYERSGLAASIATSIMMLPIIIRSADVVLRLVPGSLREAAAALGAPQWRVVWHVVLPTARSGLTTSVILGVARGIGETAPVLLTAGFTSALNLDPRSNPMVSLPLAAFQFVRSPQPALVARGFATAATLMVLVLVLFYAARVLGGRPAGYQSKRQARRAAESSVELLERIEATHGGAS
jgi:phosphate transport system permease protein